MERIGWFHISYCSIKRNITTLYLPPMATVHSDCMCQKAPSAHCSVTSGWWEKRRIVLSWWNAQSLR